MNAPKLIQSPLNPGWLIPEGWEQILGVRIDYRLGHSVLHLWRVQWNQHVGTTFETKPHTHDYHHSWGQGNEGAVLLSLIHAHLIRLLSLCLRATQRAQGFGEHFPPAAWRHSLIAERAQRLIRKEAVRPRTRGNALTFCISNP